MGKLYRTLALFVWGKFFLEKGVGMWYGIESNMSFIGRVVYHYPFVLHCRHIVRDHFLGQWGHFGELLPDTYHPFPGLWRDSLTVFLHGLEFPVFHTSVFII